MTVLIGLHDARRVSATIYTSGGERMGALEFIDANGGRVTIHLEPYLADRATRIAALWKQMDDEDSARAEEVEVIMPGIKRGNEAPMSAVGDAAFVAAAMGRVGESW